ncbi:T9SS type A sorting domain-containing protein [Flavobacterium sp.]|uniref:T9SS type A sorting domain-containing protein n=1 Tax=Flavobacterium sp. TaxID=239 RepID=UPI003D6B49AF
MRKFTFKPPKIVMTLFFLCSHFLIFAQTPTIEPRFKTFQTGTAFTAIAVDQNKNVWAGTDRQGVYFLNQDSPTNTFTLTSLGTAPTLASLRIQTMAADKSGGIWVGHGGINTSNAQGGVEKITVATNAVQHLSPDRDARGFTFLQRDGLGTANAQQVVVDPFNKVWIAHRYHDLTSSPDYIVTPGTFSSRMANADGDKFNAVSTWQDVQTTNVDPNLPYPAFTYNPTPSQTAQSRTCNAISADNESMWVSVFPYTTHISEVFLPSRLLQYELDGTFVKSYKVQDAKFTLGGNFHGVYANNAKGVWVTTTIVNNGFSVLKEGRWYNITSAALMPPGTRFNRAAIWGDNFGKVYLGTNNGLIVYDGMGPVNSADSYTLYTKTEYTSYRSVHDPNMLSNDILAGITEGEERPYFSWIVTSSGIMRSFIPQGDVMVYHINDKNTPFYQTSNGKQNYIPIAELKVADGYYPGDEDKPAFAADGTESSVIKYKTDLAVEFYEYNSKFSFEIRKQSGSFPSEVPGTNEYIDRYGEFILKPLSFYGNNVTAEDLESVEFIYRHPKYINPDDLSSGKNYAEYELLIWDKTDELNPHIIFQYPIKLSLPPILLGHGVWTDVGSLAKLESYLMSKGYSEYELLKVWRKNKEDAEHPFEADALVIPNAINELRNKAMGRKVSAGKVNVIVHSRGGLYTRAYIEGISPQTYYKDDINSLITLNTPHSGSHAANAAMDKRIAIPGINIPIMLPIPLLISQNLSVINFSLTDPVPVSQFVKPLVPDADEVDNWGAKNLMVENDVLSGSYNRETEFVKNLNKPENLQKLTTAQVPIHAVATTFDLCQLSPILCNGESNFDVPIGLRGSAFWLTLTKESIEFLLDQGVQSLSDFVKYLYGNQTNDVVVPSSSMKAGLNSQFISTLSGENIAHSNITINPGVTESIPVHDRIYTLLKQNPNASNSNFTKNGVTPPALTYNFLPNLPPASSNRLDAADNSDKKIVINPESFPTLMNSGDAVTFKVYQENLDKIMIAYQYPGIEDIFLCRKVTGLAFENNFTFNIPQEFFGKFTVTAYGFSDGKLVAKHIVEPSFPVQLPQSITLQSIRFSKSEETIPEQSQYIFELLGMYSDGIERRINDLNGVVFTIGDQSILQQINSKIIKGLIPGESTFKATLGSLNTTISIYVEENPSLRQSIITDFYGQYDTPTSPIHLKWNTYHEYRSKHFTLERSENNDQNFVEINQQLGRGTYYNPTNYTFTDNTALEHVFYRLKLYNLDDELVYNQIIEINRAVLSNGTHQMAAPKLELVPNPLTTYTGSLLVQDLPLDNEAVLTIYDINGKMVCSKKCTIVNGDQKIAFEIPTGAKNGIYLVQLKTKSFSKTVKLLLNL